MTFIFSVCPWIYSKNNKQNIILYNPIDIVVTLINLLQKKNYSVFVFCDLQSIMYQSSVTAARMM